MTARCVSLALAAALAAGCGARGDANVGGAASAPGVALRRAVAWGAPGVAGASAGLEITLDGADTLVAVASARGSASVHASKHEGRHGMFPAGPLPLAAGRTMLDGEDYHIMLEGLPAPVKAGDTLALEFRFARAGTVAVVVPVLRYSDALSALGR